MKASARFSRPPSAYLGGKEWGSRDHLLTFAYQLYLDTKCAHCGGSLLECRNPDNEGAYEALDTTCYRRAAVEERTSGKNFKAEPGQLFYAAPIDDDLISGSGLTLTAHTDADEQGNEPGESD